MSGQQGWAEHAALMNDLARGGFILLGGPLEEGVRILLIVDAESESAIRAVLAADPWAGTALLSIVAVEHWEIQLGSLPKR